MHRPNLHPTLRPRALGASMHLAFGGFAVQIGFPADLSPGGKD
jgi:hypothetical protein